MRKIYECHSHKNDVAVHPIHLFDARDLSSFGLYYVEQFPEIGEFLHQHALEYLRVENIAQLTDFAGISVMPIEGQMYFLPEGEIE